MFLSSMLIGVIFVIGGLLLLSRKKFMVSRLWSTFFFLLIWGSFIKTIGLSSFLTSDYIMLIIVIILSLAFGVMMSRDKYFFYNVNNEMLISTLIRILEERNIVYRRVQDAFVLKDNGNKTITYKQSLNTVEINLKDIKQLPFHQEIKEDLRAKIKEINTKLFPSMGVFSMIVGIVIIMMVLYFNNRM
ncbi:hypothetical protein SAMN05660297_03511 [Natronincola peptidivorans]|uniref:Uncharacterized protein n=1 Tax=Natronincola peptidivorans TaxID=426128 RepID=A0A1I0H5N9_9FIRM|nr:hypothetical protein [Natronincola peptidivorans]SET79045.1 hypothetical protein SAMN05660297_03511 [Natronincola peptidivorans]